MAKFHSKLHKKEVNKLLYKLCLAISEIKTAKEAAEFLRDLLSYQEAEMIAKRLKIAELIMDNLTYDQIQRTLKVSPTTIARVQEWMKLSGEGYRRAVERTRKDWTKDNVPEYDEFSGINSIKKRYPMYYWPELLLESIIRSANKREKERIRNVLGEMEKSKAKTELFLKLKKILISPNKQ